MGSLVWRRVVFGVANGLTVESGHVKNLRMSSLTKQYLDHFQYLNPISEESDSRVNASRKAGTRTVHGCKKRNEKVQTHVQ